MSDGTFFALDVVLHGEESSNFDILSDASLDEKRESLLVECGSLIGSAPLRSILPMVGGMFAVALAGETCVATDVERLRSCRFIFTWWKCRRRDRKNR